MGGDRGFGIGAGAGAPERALEGQEGGRDLRLPVPVEGGEIGAEAGVEAGDDGAEILYRYFEGRNHEVASQGQEARVVEAIGAEEVRGAEAGILHQRASHGLGRVAQDHEGRDAEAGGENDLGRVVDVLAEAHVPPRAVEKRVVGEAVARAREAVDDEIHARAAETVDVAIAQAVDRGKEARMPADPGAEGPVVGDGEGRLHGKRTRVVALHGPSLSAAARPRQARAIRRWAPPDRRSRGRGSRGWRWRCRGRTPACARSPGRPWRRGCW